MGTQRTRLQDEMEADESSSDFEADPMLLPDVTKGPPKTGPEPKFVGLMSARQYAQDLRQEASAAIAAKPSTIVHAFNAQAARADREARRATQILQRRASASSNSDAYDTDSHSDHSEELRNANKTFAIEYQEPLPFSQPPRFVGQDVTDTVFDANASVKEPPAKVAQASDLPTRRALSNQLNTHASRGPRQPPSKRFVTPFLKPPTPSTSNAHVAPGLSKSSPFATSEKCSKIQLGPSKSAPQPKKERPAPEEVTFEADEPQFCKVAGA